MSRLTAPAVSESPDDPSVVIVPPPAAAAVFGDRLEFARAYAALLCGPGEVRGIIGPRERGRIWERHLLNCAVLAPLMPAAAHVLDVGSGGGLPGVVLALARPDLRLTLVDSMKRRTDFLTEVVEALELTAQVEVVRGRAEELRRKEHIVTARAVADPIQLATWSRRLLAPGGRLVLLVGQGLAAGSSSWLPGLQRAGWQHVTLSEQCLSNVAPTLVLQASRR